MAILSGLDDTLIDLVYWFNIIKYKRMLPKFKDIGMGKEKSIALIICAWKEFRVIERTLNTALEKLKYSNYKIFVGVYPNDLKTIDVVKGIEKINNRVKVCINVHDGPTTKADNLNNVYNEIKKYEDSAGKQFEVIVIHDSEDFIHAHSLKLFSHIFDKYKVDAAQIPVVPIKDKRGKFIHRMYCDGFAELHSKDLIVRQAINAFIPFAGTGMAFTRKIFTFLEKNNEQVFNDANLTEDYELGIKLFKSGFKVRFINLPTRKESEATIIATKEYFPNSFWGAVKQRSRWTAGICFQNWRMHKWHGSFKTKYFLMHDRKTVMNNLLMMVFEIVFMFFLLDISQQIFHYKIIDINMPRSGPLWYALWSVFAFMLSRLSHRFFFTYKWYGAKYACFSLVRILVDNFVNFFATIRAIKVFSQMKQKIVWESTDHY